MMRMNRIMKKKAVKFFDTAVPVILLILYLLSVFFLPGIEKEVRKISITAVLLVSSFFDIRDREIPLLACISVSGISIIHAIFVSFSLFSWIVSFVLLSVFLVLYSINKNNIGLGDIFIVSLCVQSLLPEDAFRFLFLTFALSSLAGLIKCIRAKSMKNVAIPLSPCIAAAFIILLP